ncbi:hypothetical protein ACVIHI_006932 [Bradyrhizobium sp. USDA 4524]|uniref:hypothetical protein n=1 Tax=unclassified Bradyrhizobium TaxID=2631580 RepID=UPI0035C74269|nr:hypothetical protein [Bradyrhizobium sp. USDA 4538]MCP1900714.1 hypothetical protein [Bradyrhizobium sp. USDA 4537]MCP1993630.1 hypothetical protein [Bradyrhizobium sp. USDA 4539]
MRNRKGVQICLALLATALLLDTGTALAQSATHGNLKTIGTPSAAQAQIVPSLIVLNSRGATLQGDSLVLAELDHIRRPTRARCGPSAHG